MSKHILSVLVENHSGVLSRVAGLFSRRGFNIDSVASGVTENPEISRITIVVDGDDYTVDQVSKQLNKLVDVKIVMQLEKEAMVARELGLIKVHAPAENRSEIIQIVEIFRAKIIDVSPDSLMVEISGTGEKIQAMIELLHKFGIKEIVRTGTIALERGSQYIDANKNEEE